MYMYIYIYLYYVISWFTQSGSIRNEYTLRSSNMAIEHFKKWRLEWENQL